MLLLLFNSEIASVEMKHDVYIGVVSEIARQWQIVDH